MPEYLSRFAMYSVHESHPSGRALTARRERRAYATDAVITAISIIRKDFFNENLASAAECVIDSKPTKAHGASAKMVNTLLM